MQDTSLALDGARANRRSLIRSSGTHSCVCVVFVVFPACVVAVVLGEYICLQRELESIPLTADERTQRERRAAQQAQINASSSAGASSGSSSSSSTHLELSHHPAERSGLLSNMDDEPSSNSSGGKGVTTSTIRLTPNNIFNV